MWTRHGLLTFFYLFDVIFQAVIPSAQSVVFEIQLIMTSSYAGGV